MDGQSKWVVAAIVAEGLGVLWLALIYLHQFNEESAMEGNKLAMWTLITAGAYALALAISGASQRCLNPAFAVGYDLVWTMDDGGDDPWKYIWILVAMPFAGAFLATFAYRFLVKEIAKPHAAAYE